MREFFSQQPLARRLPEASLLAAAVLAICACDGDSSGPTNPPGPVVGSGIVVTQSRNVSGVTGVSLNVVVGQLLIEQTGVESLTITGDDNILPLLTSDVIAGQLVLGLRDDVGAIAVTTTIVYRLTVRELHEIGVSGPSEAEATGIDTSFLTVSLDGPSVTTISGTADQQTIDIDGPSSYNAAGLQSREITITAAGPSRATVRVSERLDVTFSEPAATVEYFGDPTVTVSGNGALRRLGP